jgi:kynurenine formamidase
MAKASKPKPRPKSSMKAKPAPKLKVAPKPKPKLKPVAAKAKAVAMKAKAVKPRAAAKPASKSAVRPVAPPRQAAPPAPRSIPSGLPDYDALPTRPGAPAGSAWGLFGDDDQVGTINLMTPDRVKQAAGFIRSGKVFALNLPINIPDPPIFGRGKHSHHIKQFNGYILDDYLDNFYPQASSQWDALCHVKHPSHGGYNGVPEDETTGYGGTKLGIDNLAKRGIAGRGILADIARYYESVGKSLDHRTNDVVPFEDLVATLEAQKTKVWPGDVLLVRVGWTQAYLDMTSEEKAALAADTKTPGIEGSARTARWLWNNHISAVASDSPGLEAIPPPNVSDFTAAGDLLHFHMLSFFGMPIGEMWNLEELAEDCANDNNYEFFFTSAPLNIPGGVGSPPNAIAIK